jgi:S-adenosylmethionine decarboxylase
MSWVAVRIAALFGRGAGRGNGAGARPQIVGRHLVATYHGCAASALLDGPGLLAALREAVRASGASILDEAQHVFPNGGLTAVILLAESHASIHTYPEVGACFVDLFTCCRACGVEQFDARLRAYLVPGRVERRVLTRDGSANAAALSARPLRRNKPY